MLSPQCQFEGASVCDPNGTREDGATGASWAATPDTLRGRPHVILTKDEYLPVPVPVVYEEIAMSGSVATAWSPPVIYSISPNQWPAGATTTFTISGDGFGYDPDLTISGAGIVSYTPKCLSAPSPSCNTQIGNCDH